jgi:hypothetical protein
MHLVFECFSTNFFFMENKDGSKELHNPSSLAIQSACIETPKSFRFKDSNLFEFCYSSSTSSSSPETFTYPL